MIFARQQHRKTFQSAIAVLTCVSVLIGTPTVHAALSNIPFNTYSPNNTVNAIATSGTTTYIGGTFTWVGPITGPGVPIDTVTGQPVATFPKVSNLTVTAVVPDGDGGWYIGGSFTKVEGLNRNRLAHILPDGTLDEEWKPSANGTVFTLVLSDGVLYIGGVFQGMNGVSRNRLAAIEASGTGNLLPFNPDADSQVVDMKLSGATLYVGGQFTTIGGQTRGRLAAIDIATGQADPTWNPNVGDNIVNTLLLSGNTVYLGGTFVTVGGVTRNRVAAVEATGTGNLLPFNPDASSTVSTFAIDGNTLYVGGAFTTIGGQSKTGLVAVEATGTGNLITSFAPASNGTVNRIIRSAGTLYVGGTFTSMGGQTRKNLASVDATTGLATALDPHIDGLSSTTVNSMSLDGSILYVGGSYTTVGGQARNRVAAFSSTGGLLPWNPDANSTVNALYSVSPNIYIGGAFTTINGLTRNRIAAVSNSGTGQLISVWTPSVDNSSVLTIASLGTSLLLGGSFTAINGVTRNRIGAVSTTGTGNLITTWNPNSNGPVNAIGTFGLFVYVGGTFTAFGATGRTGLGQFSGLATSTPTAFNASLNNTVSAIAIGSVLAYVGGAFTFSSITARNRASSYLLNTSTVSLSSWDPNANGTVSAIGFGTPGVLLGGSFTTIGGVTRNRLALVGTTTATLDSWNPNASSTVSAVRALGSDAIAGGSFTTMSGSYSPYYAYFKNLTSTTTTLSSSDNPSTEGDDVTFTATVSNAAATGRFTLTDGGTFLGSAPIRRGSGSLVISDLTLGSHPLMALYSGDAVYRSSSGTLTQVVTAPTTTTLTSSLNPSIEGYTVTLSAAVSPAAATGTVTFYSGSTALNSITLGHGSGSYATDPLTVGSYSFSAVYNGNGDYLTSTSSTLIQVVSAIGAGSSSSTVSSTSSDTSSVDSSSSDAASAASVDAQAGTASGGGGGRGASGPGARSPAAAAARQALLDNYKEQLLAQQNASSAASAHSRSSAVTIVQQHSSARSNASNASASITIAENRGYLQIQNGLTITLFRDVPIDAWYAPYISFLLQEKIARGYTDDNGNLLGIFGVDDPVTYAELAKLVLESSGNEPMSSIQPPRNPSARGTWASSYIAQAEKLGLSVYDPSLDVHTPATRGEVIQTILEGFGIPAKTKSVVNFSDLPASHEYAQAIAVAVFYGLIDGDTDAAGNSLGTVRPDDEINRAEVAKIVSMAYQLLK